MREHWEQMENLSLKSHMLKHYAESHRDIEPTDMKFEMKVLKKYRTSFERQIGESVYINYNLKKGVKMLNSRNEYNRCIIPRLVVEEDESLEEYLENQRELKLKHEIEKLRLKFRDGGKEQKRKRRKLEKIENRKEERIEKKKSEKREKFKWTKKRIEKFIESRKIKEVLNLEDEVVEAKKMLWYKMKTNGKLKNNERIEIMKKVMGKIPERKVKKETSVGATEIVTTDIREIEANDNDSEIVDDEKLLSGTPGKKEKIIRTDSVNNETDSFINTDIEASIVTGTPEKFKTVISVNDDIDHENKESFKETHTLETLKPSLDIDIDKNISLSNSHLSNLDASRGVNNVKTKITKSNLMEIKWLKSHKKSLNDQSYAPKTSVRGRIEHQSGNNEANSEVVVDKVSKTQNKSRYKSRYNRQKRLPETAIEVEKNKSEDIKCDTIEKWAKNTSKIGPKSDQNCESDLKCKKEWGLSLSEKTKKVSYGDLSNANSGLTQPSSAKLSCVGFLVGGEGNIDNNGLTERPPPAENLLRKSDSVGLTVGMFTASQIAQKGESQFSMSDNIRGRKKVQLKLSPQNRIDNSIDGGSENVVSNDEFDLEKSDLFKVKLKMKDIKDRDQRHLYVEHVDSTISYEPKRSHESSEELS